MGTSGTARDNGMSDEHYEALWTTEEVARRYSVHKDNVPDEVKKGRIPPPLEGWTGGTKRWLASECIAHMRAMRKREMAEQLK